MDDISDIAKRLQELVSKNHNTTSNDGKAFETVENLTVVNKRPFLVFSNDVKEATSYIENVNKFDEDSHNYGFKILKNYIRLESILGLSHGYYKMLPSFDGDLDTIFEYLIQRRFEVYNK